MSQFLENNESDHCSIVQGNDINEFVLFIKTFTGELESKNILDIGYDRDSLIPLLFPDEEIIRNPVAGPYRDTYIITREANSGLDVTLEYLDTKLNEKTKYDVILMNRVIEYIPVYQMETIWKKIISILRPGGRIIIKTPLFENMNSPKEENQDYNQAKIQCHKQTFSTMLRTCLEKKLLLAAYQKNCFGLVKADDLQTHPKELAESYAAFHRKIVENHNLEVKDSYEEAELRNLVPGAGRLLMGCVTENFSPYREQALRLVKSIRWFGGDTAGVNILICVVNNVDPEFEKELQKWGAIVRVVEKFNTPHKPSNKLRLFELEEVGYYDTVMLLDCDTILLQDPYPYIDGYHFQAEFAVAASVRLSTFEKIFEHYNLKMPEPNYFTSVSYQPTIWYCNAGVLVFPQHLLQSFFPLWKEYTIDLAQKPYLLGKSYFYCEQASLTLAFLSNPIPFKKLPIEMNFPLLPYTNSPKLKKCDPVILHYHKRVNNKGLLNWVYTNPYAQKRIKEFNRQLLKEYPPEIEN